MSPLHLVPYDAQSVWDVHEWRNAAAVLSGANPAKWEGRGELRLGVRTTHPHRKLLRQRGPHASDVRLVEASLPTTAGEGERARRRLSD